MNNNTLTLNRTMTQNTQPPFVLSARKVLNANINDLWKHLKGPFVLRFDDGQELQTDARATLISHYIWEIHRRFPRLPLLAKHHVSSTVKHRRWNASSHIDVINLPFWDVFDIYKKEYKQNNVLTGELAKLAYEISNTLYNVLSYDLGEHVVRVDVLDCIEIARHPKVVAARKLLTKDKQSIATFNATIASTIRSEAELQANHLSRVMQAGLVRENQALQVLGVRGYVTDIDQIDFNEPILRGFLEGIVSLVDSMMETRSASISLLNSGTQLETSEYFSRRQQLICIALKNLHQGDCGSTKHLKVTLHGGGKRDGVYHPSDFSTWVGMNYLDEDSGTYKPLKKSDTHLVGKTLNFRSIVAGCNHADIYGVCETCFGQLGESVPENTNLGHLCCMTLMAILGQGILSTKHFLASSDASGIALPDADKEYLYVQPGKNFYYLSSALKNRKLTLGFDASCLPGIADLSQVDDVYDLNEQQVSNIGKVRFYVGDKDDVDTVDVTSVSVINGGMFSNLTHPFLEYMKNRGIVRNKQENYEVSMDDWDWSEPIMVAPMRQHSTSDTQG